MDTINMLIDGGNQIYLRPDPYSVYSWIQESGEPIASHNGFDRLILCTPKNINPMILAEWLNKHNKELDNIIVLWNVDGGWENEYDELTLAIKKLQDEFDRDLVYGEINFVSESDE